MTINLLYYAIDQNVSHVIVLDLLERVKCDPNYVSPETGLSCIELACLKRQSKIIEVLIEHGVNTETPKSLMAYFFENTLSDMIIDNFYQNNQKNMNLTSDYYCNNNSIETKFDCFSELFNAKKNKMDINSKNYSETGIWNPKEGITFLQYYFLNRNNWEFSWGNHYANSKNTECWMRLIINDLGADINAQDYRGYTILHYAILGLNGKRGDGYHNMLQLVLRFIDSIDILEVRCKDGFNCLQTFYREPVQTRMAHDFSEGQRRVIETILLNREINMNSNKKRKYDDSFTGSLEYRKNELNLL